MVSIDIDLSGIDELRSELKNLEQRWEDEPEWAVGTNENHGRILEFGRGPIEPTDAEALKFEVDGETVFAQRVSGHPPYPWFRPAIREFEANPRQFIRDITAYDSIEAIPNVETFVEAVASGLVNRMRDNVNAQDAGADRSPGTHPEHPKRDTGDLTASIQAIRLQ